MNDGWTKVKVLVFYVFEFPFRLQDLEELTWSLFAVVLKCAARSDIKVHFALARHSSV